MHLEFNNPEVASALQDVVSDTYKTIWYGWRIWMVLIELRMLIQFFININPYFYPMYYLWTVTDLAFNFGRQWYPKIIGYDLCFVINFTLIHKFEAVLDRLAHGLDKYNHFKITGKPLKPKVNPLPPAPITEAKLDVSHSGTEDLLAMSDESNLIDITSFELANNQPLHPIFLIDFSHLIHF
jgi:hypothetical protein|tara:strand:+ start:1275 stop:1820 length:546 start_codon:yes stop_codon:yes gene_type:complete